MDSNKEEFKKYRDIGRKLLHCHQLKWEDYLQKFEYAFAKKNHRINSKKLNIFERTDIIKLINQLPEVLEFCFMNLSMSTKRLHEIGICVGFIIQVYIEFAYKENKPHWYNNFTYIVSQMPEDWISYTAYIES